MRPQSIIPLASFTALFAISISVYLAYIPPQTVSASPIPVETLEPQEPVQNALPADSLTKLGAPIHEALLRVTKKPFGIEIHPETSPVPNDRFNGFHVGVDFEVFHYEHGVIVPIMAACDGPLISKAFVKGYGGAAVQTCDLDGEKVSIIYGHLDLKSIEAERGRSLKRGQIIGFLGEGGSPETDGVRKHLHFGIHRGEKIDMRGYVQTTSEIEQWLDVLLFL